MPTVKQIPGRLDIVATQNDKFSILLDFDVDTSGFTFSAVVDEGDGSTTNFAVTNATDSTTGQVTISIPSTDTALLALGDHNWRLDRTDNPNQRRYLAGKFTVIKYRE